MKKKIIVIDDDPGIQDIFRILFERAGYEIAIVEGRLVLEGTYDYPDIFILDRQLSGLDGLNICVHLKKNKETKDIPVIMVSATPDVAKLALAAGADDFIEKPFNIADLLQIINNQLKKAVK